MGHIPFSAAIALLVTLSALLPAGATAPACPWFDPPPATEARDVDPRWERIAVGYGKSMYPLLRPGHKLLVERWVREPRLCEIVLYHCGGALWVHQVIRMDYEDSLDGPGARWVGTARGTNNGRDDRPCHVTEETMVGVVRGVVY